jgi:hypothetical protein
VKASKVSAQAGSNLRTRLYWVWQAWRLRNAAAVEAAGSASICTNFAAIEHRGFADSLCELAEALSMNTPGLVAESRRDIRARLARDLGARSVAVVLSAGKHVTGGYAWGHVLHGAAALATLRRLPSLAAVSERDWGAAAVAIGERVTLVLHDIGLDARYRYGFAPLKQLLKPLFDLGVAQAARRALWWAPRTSPLYGLSLAFGAREIGNDEGVAFFVHNDIALIARVLSALPAGEISALLARIGPPRQARTRISALPAHVAARLAADCGTDADDEDDDSATFADYTAAIAAADYPGVDAHAAANDEDELGDAAETPTPPQASEAHDAPRIRFAGDHPPLHALPQRLSALFARHAV